MLTRCQCATMAACGDEGMYSKTSLPRKALSTFSLPGSCRGSICHRGPGRGVLPTVLLVRCTGAVSSCIRGNISGSMEFRRAVRFATLLQLTRSSVVSGDSRPKTSPRTPGIVSPTPHFLLKARGRNQYPSRSSISARSDKERNPPGNRYSAGHRLRTQYQFAMSP